jgi:hypothetical protein
MKKAILLCTTVFFATTLVYGAPQLLINLSQWEYNTQYALHQTCCAALQAYDLDKDGVTDIVIPFRKEEDRVMAVNGQTGAVKWIYPPPDQDPLSGDPMGAPCIGDMEGDGKDEVLFTGRNTHLYAVDAATGAEKFVWEGNGNDEAVCLYDINGDGTKEAVFQAKGSVAVVDHTGTLVWQYDMTSGSSAPPNAFDINKDDKVEILCGDGNGNLYCLTDTGSELWRFQAGDKYHHHQPVIADFNNDGEYEIAVHSNDKHLYLLSFWGAEIWRFPVAQDDWEVQDKAGQHEGGVAASDVNGDGTIEIITSDVTGHVYCVRDYEEDGVHVPLEVWHYKLPWEVWSGILIGDFDGDMYPEVVVEGEGDEDNDVTWDDQGYTAILDGATGEEDFYFPYWFTASTPSAADFNGDGNVDLIMQAWGEPFHILTANTPWNDGMYFPWPYKYKTASNNAVIEIGDTTWPIPWLDIEWTKEYETEYGLHQTCCAAMNAYDLDKDGTMDMVIPFRKEEDRVMAVSAKDGAVKWIYPPPDQDPLSGDPMGSPCIGDMEGDGKDEVLFTGRNTHLYAVDAATGAEKFVWEGGGRDEAVCLYDVTGDGMKEAVFQADGTIAVVDHTGTLVWQYQMTSSSSAPPNVFDINKDDKPEILLGDGNGNLYCMTDTGSELWRFQAGDKYHHHQPVIADFNNDDEYEVVVHSNDRYLYCLSFFGTEYWRFPVGSDYWETNDKAGQHEGGVAAADLDGDGDLEIVTTDVIGNVHCVDGGGKEVWHYKGPSEIWTGVTILDFTGDGELDVIVVAEGQGAGLYPFGITAVLSKDGELQAALPYAYSASTPSFGDFDNDGIVEGFFQAWSEPFHVVSYGGAYNPSLMPWPYKYKTPSNNGVWSMNEGMLVMSAFALLSLVYYRKRR